MTEGHVTRLLVAYPDRATVEGVAETLTREDGIDVTGTATSADEALRLAMLKPRRVDIVVASAQLPEPDVLKLANALRDGEGPRLVVTGLAGSHSAILRYLEAGVDAHLEEDLSLAGLVLVVRLLDRGETLLSPRLCHRIVTRLHELARICDRSDLDVSRLGSLTFREREVLELLGRRLTNTEIAEKLFIEVGTVKSHVHAILEKLRVATREEAARYLLLSPTVEE